MEKYRQAVLPADDFAIEAVSQYHAENDEVDGVLSQTLQESADVLTRREFSPRQLDNVRGFLGAMIGFGKDQRQDNIRRMNRPTRSGK